MEAAVELTSTWKNTRDAGTQERRREQAHKQIAQIEMACTKESRQINIQEWDQEANRDHTDAG
jgi:hypothetical protein